MPDERQPVPPRSGGEPRLPKLLDHGRGRVFQLDPNFEPAPERDEPPPVTTTVTFGNWISPNKGD